MGPVRQNPIQRTVSLFICVCIPLCTIVAHNIAQNRPDSFPPYPPDNHHCSDDVYLREGGCCRLYKQLWRSAVIMTTLCNDLCWSDVGHVTADRWRHLWRHSVCACRCSGIARLDWRPVSTFTLSDVTQLACLTQTPRTISTTQHTSWPSTHPDTKDDLYNPAHGVTQHSPRHQGQSLQPSTRRDPAGMPHPDTKDDLYNPAHGVTQPACLTQTPRTISTTQHTAQRFCLSVTSSPSFSSLSSVSLLRDTVRVCVSVSGDIAT